jgi:hypothetical protein
MCQGIQCFFNPVTPFFKGFFIGREKDADPAHRPFV